VLVLIPAFNEGANLQRVVYEIRRAAPEVDIVVVNDGSTDATHELLPRLAVHWLTLPYRIGVGGAVRAGLRFALRRGYGHVIRIDGDGQHRARDIARLLGPVAIGQADVVVGSRYIGCRGRSARSVSKSALSLAMTLLTCRRVTDATSGCWVFGPRAVRLLARSHPTGYPEPELLLLLHRHGLHVDEVPVRARARHSGRTTLTWFRTAAALARTMLAMVMVPMRRIEQEGGAGGE
jgi:glycosyltransferase involved in cell wall biosynthesis